MFMFLFGAATSAAVIVGFVVLVVWALYRGSKMSDSKSQPQARVVARAWQEPSLHTRAAKGFDKAAVRKGRV